MLYRKARQEDAEALAAVFYAAVRKGDSPYSEAERAAWLPEQLTATAMVKRTEGLFVAVVEEDARVIGFMGLREADGYVDLAFVLPEARGQGAFRLLFESIEERARQLDVSRLWTHASLMAQPAFRAMGFRVIHHETIDRAGEQLRRALMEKPLT